MKFIEVFATPYKFITFKTSTDYEIVIDRKKAKESHNTILQTYNIERDSSPDLTSFYENNYKIASNQP